MAHMPAVPTCKETKNPAYPVGPALVKFAHWKAGPRPGTIARDYGGGNSFIFTRADGKGSYSLAGPDVELVLIDGTPWSSEIVRHFIDGQWVIVGQ